MYPFVQGYPGAAGGQGRRSEARAGERRLNYACLVALGLAVLDAHGGAMPFALFVEDLLARLKAAGTGTGAGVGGGRWADGARIRSLLTRIEGRLRVGSLSGHNGAEMVYDRERCLPPSDYFCG